MCRVEEVEELKQLLEVDPQMDTITMDIKLVCYAPWAGYKEFLFRYKHAYVLLHDLGNGFFSFHTKATILDLLLNYPVNHIIEPITGLIYVHRMEKSYNKIERGNAN